MNSLCRSLSSAEVEARHSEGGKGRRLSGIVGDLIAAVRDAAHEGQPAGRIEHCRQIEKALFLRSVVVNGVIRRGRILDSEIAAEIAPGDEILGLSDGAAVFQRRRDGAVAAAIDTDAAAVVEGVGLGLDVEDTRGAQAILRRQRPGDQGEAADDPGIDDLSERADAVGQHDAVDAVLQVRVFVAHMQFAACRGVLRYAGNLQQRLVERGVGTLRQRLKGLLAQFVGAGTGRRHDIAAGFVEGRVLAGDRLGLGLRRRCRGFETSLGYDMCRGPARMLHLLWRGDVDLRQRGRRRGRGLRVYRAAEAAKQQRGGSGGGQHWPCK